MIFQSCGKNLLGSFPESRETTQDVKWGDLCYDCVFVHACVCVCVCVYMRARACVCESSTAWSDVTSIRAVDWELRVAVQVPCVQETDWLCLAKKKKEQRIFVRQRRRGANVMVENWESQQLKTKVAGHMWSFFYQALCCHVHCFWSKWSWPSPETLIPVQRGFAACFEGWTA